MDSKAGLPEDLEGLAGEERPLELWAPRRASPWRLLLAVLAAPLLLAIPLEVVLWPVGALFTDLGFLSTRDMSWRAIEPAEGELFRPRPGVYPPEYVSGFRINSLGFRGGEFAGKEGGRLRILALGDSTVFGLMVGEEEAWPALLEERLNEGVDEWVEVLNLGRVATSSHGTRIDVERYAGGLEPDAMIVSVGWWNDYQLFHEDAGLTEREAVEVELFREGWEAANSPWMMLRLYRIGRLWMTRNKALEDARETAGWIAEGRFSEGAGEEPRRVPVGQFRENLGAMIDWGREHGVAVFVTTPALSPEAEGVYTIVREYDRAIREVAEERGVPVIDTRAFLLEAHRRPNPKEVYIDMVHLERQGLRELADFLASELVPELKPMMEGSGG